MCRSPSIWSIGLFLTLAAVAILQLAPRPTASFGGPFALRDQDGAEVSDISLRGRPFVVFFGFTRCSTVCPTAMVRLTRLRRALGPKGDSLAVLFVSVDPDDDAAALRRWLGAFPLPTIGLTGDQAARDRMMAGYHVFSRGTGFATSHSSTLFLVGASGEPRGTIEAHESDASALSKLNELVR